MRVNLSSLPAELYPHIASAIADSFCIIAGAGLFVKGILEKSAVLLLIVKGDVLHIIGNG